MLTACPRCGLVHAIGACPKKPHRNYKKYIPDAVKFRRTAAWQKKREEILQRDLYLCKVCLANEFNKCDDGTDAICLGLDTKHLQVHHIVPIEEQPELKEDDGNLITLCSWHHWMADHNKIPRKKLKDLAIIPPAKFLNLG